jgi:hypothetical protein
MPNVGGVLSMESWAAIPEYSRIVGVSVRA